MALFNACLCHPHCSIEQAAGGRIEVTPGSLLESLHIKVLI